MVLSNWVTTAFISARLWVTLTCIELALIIMESAITSDDKSKLLSQSLKIVNTRIKSLVSALVFIVCLKYFGKDLADEFTLPIVIAYCVQKFTNMGDRKSEEKEQLKEKERQKPTIGYGAGMACSYFEGYLSLMLPNDGAQFYGIEETITVYESKHSVRFPVKKMFLVVAKSLYCPPDLKQFNKNDTSLPFLEACTTLEAHKRDVGGVKGRIYRSSAYMIHRPGKEPVYLVAECATPLLTLYKVKQRRAVYEELVDADFDIILKEFCEMLERILENSRECYQKCVLVYYDDTDESQNVADLLLKKIEELEPNYEVLI